MIKIPRTQSEFLRKLDSLQSTVWALKEQGSYMTDARKKTLHIRLLEILQFEPRDVVHRMQKPRVDRLLRDLPPDIAFLKEKFPQYVAPIETLESMLRYAAEREHMLELPPSTRQSVGYYGYGSKFQQKAWKSYRP